VKVGDLVMKRDEELWIFSYEDPTNGKVSIIKKIENDMIGIILELSYEEYDYARVFIDGIIGWCYITSLKGVTNNEQ
jgi:hypothetical protein